MSRENLEFMKPQLKLEMQRLSPVPGDVLIVLPREAYDRFTDEYLDWIRENIGKIAPPGVRAMILNDRSVQFDVLTPGPVHDDPDLQRIYNQGWWDAYGALQAHYTPEPDPSEPA